ncbi:metallophosphoesterase family protein [Virgibacillus salexigens]|uniref:Calcineurin-like phosphoesterase domain-containing protein n=1 Tax=Virgibacillus massiliensis TaxID=1462526 RepID=A0A024QHL3_9BACI|nr:hypothetical protein [Virgibacillus massiliensis]CDQ41752.1 hypothetical protein BN990_04129 [Virgibacillus massiliensis]
MSKKTINWSSAEGKKATAFILSQHRAKVKYKDIANEVNEKFDLPKPVTYENIRYICKRKKSIVDKKNTKTAKTDAELVEIYEKIDEEEAKQNEKEEQEQAIKKAKEDARKRKDKQLLSKLLKERGTTELIIETFEETIKAFEWIDIKPPKPIKGTKDNVEEAILLFSDAQIGEHISEEDTQGFGEYNINIFKERMDKLVRQVRENVASHRLSKNIQTLNLFMLGDNVDGIGIYRGQEHHLDALVVEQLLVGAEKIAESIIHLLGTFEKINITGIVGNHGRIGRKGENPSHVNYDFLLYKMLEKMLQNYKERIEWTIPKSNWILKDVLGNGFLLLHGDTIKGWNGIPYYGIDRADSRLTKMLQSQGKTYKYLCLGHHHNPGDVDSPNGEKILNGTMVGGSSFSINQLHTTSRPSQWFFGINKEAGITWRYKLLLDMDDSHAN